MFSVRESPDVVTIVFHGRRWTRPQDAVLGEGLHALGLPAGRVIGATWEATLKQFAAALDPHPERRLLEENLDQRVSWLYWQTGAPAGYESVFDAFAFYRDVFGDLCPEVYPAFLALLQTEPVLYAEPNIKPYREHLTHPIYVFLTGRQLLDQFLNLDEFDRLAFGRLARAQNFRERLIARLPVLGAQQRGGGGERLDEWEDLLDSPWRRHRVIRLAWLVTALCHDLAYPTVYAAGRAHHAKSNVVPLRSVPIWSGRPELRDFIFGSLLFHDLRERHREYVGDSELLNDVARSVLKNHSFGSALIVLATLKSILGRAPLGQAASADVLDLMVAWELAADAIALHDIALPQKAGEVANYVPFDLNPLGWLLRTLDLLQEWDRPVRRLASSRVEYVHPFEGVSLRIEAGAKGTPRVSAVDRLVNRELIKTPEKPCPLDGFCNAGRQACWADHTQPRPEPPCDCTGSRTEVAVAIDPATHATPSIFYTVVCSGRVRRVLGWDRVRHSRVPAPFQPGNDPAHERWFYRFWPQAVRDYLGTGDNAMRLGTLLWRMRAD